MRRALVAPPCGTVKAREAHRRRGEPIDEACRRANRLYENERSRRRRAAKRAAAAARSKHPVTATHRAGPVRFTPQADAPRGTLAGTDQPHAHVPDGNIGTTCVRCFGWCNDPRHAGQDALPAVAA